jgi:hypothetical protein
VISYQVISWFQSLPFTFNLHRYNAVEACEVFFAELRRVCGDAEAIDAGLASTTMGESPSPPPAAAAAAASQQLVAERVAWIEEETNEFAHRVAARCLKGGAGDDPAHISDASASVLVCLGHFDALFEDFPALATATSASTSTTTSTSTSSSAGAAATLPLLARFCTAGALFAAMRGVIDAATEAYLADDGSSGSGGGAGGGGSGNWLDATEGYIESGGDAKSLRLLCEQGVAN